MDEFTPAFSFEGHNSSCRRLSHENHLFVDMDNLFENYRDIIVVPSGGIVQYLQVVDLVLPQYGVLIHFSFLIPTVAILTVYMILMVELCFQNFRTMMSL